MIEFLLPQVFWLLPLPLLVWLLLPAAPESRGGALRVPFYAAVADGLPASGARARGRAVAALTAKVLAWAALVIAAAQPRWVGEPLPIPTEGRDLMLAMDLSMSMSQEDFAVGGRAVDRHTVVNAVAREFVRARTGDRIGLVLFGSRAYLQAPLTLDRETVVQFLDESELGLAGEETAMGDAIGLSVKHLRDRPSDERVLVLLSDGANNAGVLDPAQAAELAADASVRIYTIGVGADHQVVQTAFGPRRVAASDLDEETLAAVAERTGGAYFRARDAAGLARIYQEIDALEPTRGDVAVVRPERALFPVPLSIALSLVGVLALWRGASGGLFRTQRMAGA